MFDVYLTMGSFTTPDLDDLIQQFPCIAAPDVQQRMKADVKQDPCFLGLDLPEDTALDLLKRLKVGNAVGCVVDSAYREPRISLEQAAAIAEPVLNQLIRQEFPDISFEPMFFYDSLVTTWCFGRRSPARRKIIPGTLFVDVDKIDGHIWQPDEFERINKE